MGTIVTGQILVAGCCEMFSRRLQLLNNRNVSDYSFMINIIVTQSLHESLFASAE